MRERNPSEYGDDPKIQDLLNTSYAVFQKRLEEAHAVALRQRQQMVYTFMKRAMSIDPYLCPESALPVATEDCGESLREDEASYYSIVDALKLELHERNEHLFTWSLSEKMSECMGR